MALPRETIEGLLKRAVRAPSGDNCQPWRFTVTGDTVLLRNVPEQDTSLYSWGQRSSYVAHGAFLETLSVASGAAGMSADIFPFPEGPDGPVARIELSPAVVAAHPLDDAIERRATNRRPYSAMPLMPQQREALVACAREPVRVVLAEDAATRGSLAYAAAANEKVLFENQHMHGFFFSHLAFTPEAALSASMPVATLELPPPVRAMFPVLGKWPAMKVLAGIGFAGGIMKANAATYASGAATAAFVIPDRSPRSYLECGRALQRLWLTATAHGLAMQVLAGIGFLMARIDAAAPGLSARHETLVQDANRRITDALGISGGFVALMARIGHAPEPSARTTRLSPDITWETHLS